MTRSEGKLSSRYFTLIRKLNCKLIKTDDKTDSSAELQTEPQAEPKAESDK